MAFPRDDFLAMTRDDLDRIIQKLPVTTECDLEVECFVHETRDSYAARSGGRSPDVWGNYDQPMYEPYYLTRTRLGVSGLVGHREIPRQEVEENRPPKMWDMTFENVLRVKSDIKKTINDYLAACVSKYPGDGAAKVGWFRVESLTFPTRDKDLSCLRP